MCTVQRHATRQIPGLSSLTYEERLKKLGLPTLVYRRVRGDMIEVNKIAHNFYDQNITSDILTFDFDSSSSFRGHNKIWWIN